MEMTTASRVEMRGEGRIGRGDCPSIDENRGRTRRCDAGGPVVYHGKGQAMLQKVNTPQGEAYAWSLNQCRVALVTVGERSKMYADAGMQRQDRGHVARPSYWDGMCKAS